MKQLLLNAKGCGGRGIRFQVLTPDQRTALAVEAFKSTMDGETVYAMKQREALMGAYAMLVAITEPGLKKLDQLGTAKWEKVDVELLEEKGGDLFSCKDQDALRQIFKTWHDCAPEEVDAMLGEAQEVTEA